MGRLACFTFGKSNGVCVLRLRFLSWLKGKPEGTPQFVGRPPVLIPKRHVCQAQRLNRARSLARSSGCELPVPGASVDGAASKANAKRLATLWPGEPRQSPSCSSCRKARPAAKWTYPLLALERVIPRLRPWPPSTGQMYSICPFKHPLSHIGDL